MRCHQREGGSGSGNGSLTKAGVSKMKVLPPQPQHDLPTPAVVPTAAMQCLSTQLLLQDQCHGTVSIAEVWTL